MFRDRLNAVMAERNMSQAELSTITGISRPSISQYVAGINKPTASRRKLIAERLGLPADFFEQPGESEQREITVADAAKLIGKSKRFVELGLQQGTCPFGYAVKMDRWCYYISPHLFQQYTGIEVGK